MYKSSLLPGILGLICFIFAQSASAISIDFDPSVDSGFVGDTINVDVVVSGLTAANEIVSAYDLVVGFDSGILGLTTVSFGTSLDGLFFPSFKSTLELGSGIIEVQELSLASDSELALIQADSFTLFTMTFEIMSVGVSTLSFEPHPLLGINNDVKGKNAALIPVTMGRGLVAGAERPVQVPEPGIWLLFLAGFIGFLNRSRQVSSIT